MSAARVSRLFDFSRSRKAEVVPDGLWTEAVVGTARDLVWAYDNKNGPTFWVAVDQLLRRLPEMAK